MISGFSHITQTSLTNKSIVDITLLCGEKGEEEDGREIFME